MPTQDGLRFLFDIQDKITGELVKIERQAKASAKNIDSAFTGASKSHQTSSLKLAAIEQRRVAAAQSNSTKLIAIEQRRVAAAASNSLKIVAAEKRTAAAAERATKQAGARMKRQAEAFKRSMTRLASAATVAFAAVAGRALSMASGYDAAMRSVQAKTGATGETMDRLTEQSREMGRTTVHSATEAARGQAFLAQAGFDANEILQALPATLALATAGELDLASAADIASNVLSGFRLETEHTGRVTDVLAAIAAKTNTSVSQMGVALAKAAPAAAAAGWSLEQTAAAIGRLSDAGIQGEEAGTVLKTMLARLAAPTGKLETLMTATGISVKDTTGKMLPLNDIIAQLAPHADNTGLMFELLGTRGANAGLILGSLASDDLANLTAELENSEGAAQEMADTMSGGLWGSLKSINSIVESAFISFGNRLAPTLKTVATLFGNLPSPIQEVVVVVGALAGAMGGLMLIAPQSFGALVQFPGKLLPLAQALKSGAAAQWLLNAAMTANPIALVVAAVATLVGGIYLLFTKTELGRQAFQAMAHIAKAVFATSINVAKLAIKGLADWAGWAKDKLMAMIPDFVITGLGKLKDAAAWVGDQVGTATEKISAFNERMAASAQASVKLEPIVEGVGKAFAYLDEAAEPVPAILVDTADAAGEAKKELDAAAKAAEKHAEKIADLARTLQGLPTEAATEKFEDLREAWASLDTDQQAASMGAYGDTLITAKEAAHELNAAELQLYATRKAALLLEKISAQASKDRMATDDKRAAKALEGGVAALELLIAEDEAGRAAGSAWVDGFFSTLSRAFEGGGGFLGGLKSMMSKGFGEIFSKMGGGEGGGFTNALGKIFSGEGMMGKIGGVAGKLGSKIGSFMSIGLGGVPLVGPLLAAFGPMLMKGLGKIWGKLKGMFGGPNAMEVAGREAATKARDAIIATLTDGQIAEAAAAVGNAGAGVHIAMRDAFLASGQSLAEAEAQATSWVARLHAAEMQGADAVAAVQAQMMEILGEVAAAAAEAQALMDSAISATLSAFDRAKAAGVAAYDSKSLKLPWLQGRGKKRPPRWPRRRRTARGESCCAKKRTSMFAWRSWRLCSKRFAAATRRERQRQEGKRRRKSPTPGRSQWGSSRKPTRRRRT